MRISIAGNNVRGGVKIEGVSRKGARRAARAITQRAACAHQHHATWRAVRQ